MDVLIAVLVIITLGWLFVVVVLLYALLGYKNIFFSQSRIGRAEKIFTLHKFRTLKEDVSLPLTERTFGFGNFLRKTSLDELPQVFNVLKGEMSFIGPRPLLVDYLSHFSVEQRQRHLVRPGITGLAQVSGRHSISWEEKFVYDLYYVKNMSLTLDLKIAFKTCVLLLSFHKDRSLHENRFDGQ